MAKDRYLQALRGLAISAVVLIHCLPQCAASVAIRPFLNFSVALFLFLSGVLTDERKFNAGGGLRRRISKVAGPYAFWSVIYLAAFPRPSWASGFLAFAVGSVSAQMYYLLVYSQLVLLTPVLFRLLSRYRFFVYCVTPACLLLRELAAVAGIALPLIQVFCPMWLIFYVFGLDWRRWAALIEGRTAQLVAVLFIFLIIQEVAGFWWYLTGDFNMATTQLKLGSAATSLAVIALLMAVPGSFKSRLSSTLLVDLGNASFGIYLCHILVLKAVWKLLGLFVIPLGVSTFAVWALTLAGSYSLVSLCGRYLPERIHIIVGL